MHATFSAGFRQRHRGKTTSGLTARNDGGSPCCFAPTAPPEVLEVPLVIWHRLIASRQATLLRGVHLGSSCAPQRAEVESNFESVGNRSGLSSAIVARA